MSQTATFDPRTILNRTFAPVRQRYEERDSILYALGVGFGQDPLDAGQLPFVFEEPALQAVPTMAAVLGSPGFWVREPDTGVDWRQVLHVEQGIRLLRPLPAAAVVIGQTRVTRVIDMGPRRGALIYQQREVTEEGGAALAVLTSTILARSNGGCGGDTGPRPPVHPLPERAPDAVCDLPTYRNAALLYRLSGDPNPLHASPQVAQAAGFDAPILHGLCTLGVAGHAVLRTFCDYDPARFRALSLRFSAPVYPGETVRTEMWRNGETISFRARVVERDVVVLNNGRAEVI
ncbi:MaoC/PaaZ C-terminal domain-containing protein [Thalassovita sp.]|uniref:MaoC/PaaZ C-terminal domain-containing protein n=1 Tax=Thalassovita sp. TaxID=1979401 RepID=UPI0029DE804C|nr:MaoC/PaaZ C-terminal domain-containing protein [Thalassovita sp.]